MQVIFLDIDGVLNQGQHPERGWDWAHPTCLAAFNRIVELTGAKVVVSSSWRLADDLESTRPTSALQADLDHLGVRCEVVGCTPLLNVWDEEDEFFADAPRLTEIRQWLDAHPEVTEFVVLDDMDITESNSGDIEAHDEEIEARWVQTIFARGLTDEDATTALHLLL